MLSICPTVTFFSEMEETASVIDGRACVVFLHVIFVCIFFLASNRKTLNTLHGVRLLSLIHGAQIFAGIWG